MGVAVNAAGTRLYIANQDGTITTFTLDPSGNVVPPGVPAFGAPQAAFVAVNRAGTRLYVANQSPVGSVSVFVLDPVTGNITGQQPGSPFATGSFSTDVAVNRAGTRLYVTNLDGTIKVFLLDANGDVTVQQPGSPFATGAGAFGIAVR